MFHIPDNCPTAIKQLPRDDRGYPIPFFVATQPDGTRDLRFASGEKQVACVRGRLCWVCGKRLRTIVAFVGGPMSLVNERFCDVACHPTCAEFSARNCPHLNRSSAKYRENDVPKDAASFSGANKQHPGVVGVIYCTGYESKIERVGDGAGYVVWPRGITRIAWYFEGEIVDPEKAATLWKPPAEVESQYVDQIREMIRRSGSEQ